MFDHVINKEVFEVSCKNEEVAKIMQSEIEHFTSIQINHIISSVLSEHTKKYSHLKIDKIEIDLGDILMGDFGNAGMLEKFKGMFIKEIYSMQTNNTADYSMVANTAGSLVQLNNESESIISFLLLGDLPWWADKNSTLDLDAIVQKLIKLKHASFKLFMEEHATDLPVLWRLLKQYKPSTKVMIEAWFPGLTGESIGRKIFSGKNGKTEGFSFPLELLVKFTSFLAIHTADTVGNLRETLVARLHILKALLQQTGRFNTGSRESKILENDLWIIHPNAKERLWKLIQNLSVFQVEFLLFEIFLLPGLKLDEIGLPGSFCSLDKENADHFRYSNVQQPETFTGTEEIYPGEKLLVYPGMNKEDILANGEKWEEFPSMAPEYQKADKSLIDRPAIENSQQDPGIDEAKTVSNENELEFETAREKIADSTVDEFQREALKELYVEGREKNKNVFLDMVAFLDELKLYMDENRENSSFSGHDDKEQTIIDRESSISEPDELQNETIDNEQAGFSTGETTQGGEESYPPVNYTLKYISDDRFTGENSNRPGVKSQNDTEFEKIKSTGDHRERQIAFMMKRLRVSDAVFLSYLRQLKQVELDRLEEVFKKHLHENIRRRKLIQRILDHPYLLKYNLLRLYVNFYFGKYLDEEKESVQPGGKTTNRITRHMVEFCNKIQLSRSAFLYFVEKLSTKSMIVLLDILQKQKLDSAEERNFIKKILFKLSEESILLIRFLTELPENEIQELLYKFERSSSMIEPGNKDQDIFYTYREPRKIYIENAGLCLIAMYLRTFFSRLGYLENKIFRSKAFACKAQYLLEYIATGRKKCPEYVLPLNKILCGFQVEENIISGMHLTKRDMAEADNLVQSVIDNWTWLKNTSIQGFRESFLQRKGILVENEFYWTLQVERKGFDVLLNTIPWDFRLVKLPWMKKRIQVEW